jgi:hypothetical protein
MLRNKWSAFFFVLSVLPISAVEGEVTCPATIPVAEEARLPAGWEKSAAWPVVLKGINIFEKSRPEMTIPPDDVSKASYFWRITPKSASDISVECQYIGTNFSIQRVLPKGLKECRADLDPKTLVDGNPKVIWAGCR